MASMYPPVDNSALYRRLITLQRPDLLAKVNDLRSRVDVYLRGVNTTFSHFTSHAVDHSDEVVREMSNLLHQDPTDPTTATASLNATETYLLLISAYLHDAGMVVTDKEKYQALSSDTWREFAEGNAQVASDVKSMQATLEGAGGSSSRDQQLFVTALEQRLLLADFFRRRHATRAYGAINGALRVREDFLGGDRSASETVTAICVGHGISINELSVEASYPTRRDLFNEPVNVRLLTILLRLGDLLDMRHDRACPLLEGTSSPLPPSSGIHWAQYKRVTSRVTSPSVIRITAACETADEHRLLRDWCGWITDEVRDAPRILAGSERHGSWTPPIATLGGSQASIQISRAPGARYRAEDWRFYLDEGEVVMRLVRDVHRHRFGFLRELLQNALDTTRARVYTELGAEQRYPNLLPTIELAKVPITVTLSGSADEVDTVEVADNGLGMTADIIKNYFLQIGRSWYRSREFAESFRFSPTSGFGVGFLSVFAVSRDVQVTTRFHADAPSEALRMQLTGPRGYLLFEDAARPTSGTSVRVTLDEPVETATIIDFMQKCCVANEIPIVVRVENDDATLDVLTLPEIQSAVAPRIAVSPELTYAIERIPSSEEGIFGHFDVPILIEGDGTEDWATYGSNSQRKIEQANPLVEIEGRTWSWVALNGLRSENWFREGSGDISWQFDVRTPDAGLSVGLDRVSHRRAPGLALDDLEKALDRHLASRELLADYAGKLLERFEEIVPNWADRIACWPTVSGQVVSTNDLLSAETYYLSYRPRRGLVDPREDTVALSADDLASLDSSIPLVLLPEGLIGMSYSRRNRLVSDHTVVSVHEFSAGTLVAKVSRGSLADSKRRFSYPSFAETSEIVSTKLPMDVIALNMDHPFISAIHAIPDEQSIARERLIDALVARHGGTTIHDVVSAVADALDSTQLRAYAQNLGGRDLFISQLLTSNVLKMPRDI